eukprot:TRINITY_DN26049_c0_g1_i1.p1 TRINITY_DN26049_c0_g1~~TRINITY_DN26049_c0_g1_i1.p1  ORF type:complete len:687 (+),score=130.25 TRINITY_DN26049_c0_g1_i1:48-2108(+)
MASSSVSEETLRRAVLEHIGCLELDGDMQTYLVDTALEFLGEGEAGFRSSYAEVCEPLLEDLCGMPKTQGFLDAVCASVFVRDEPETKSSGRDTEADLLCRVPDLLLMYGGSSQPLLTNAKLELFKGRLYGVVGANGTGKSTLMNRVASKDIKGLPASLEVVHVSPDKLLEGVLGAETTREWLKRTERSGTALQEAFASVGFGDATLDREIRQLSGGWQMRFALARAIAQKANLWILDEPTNHLDKEAVAWLVEFCHRTCVPGMAAALVVSHEAHFLDSVCTDVLHFTRDAKLSYHRGTFSDFKRDVLKNDEAAAEELLTGISKAKGPSSAAALGGYGKQVPNVGAEEQMMFPKPDKLPKYKKLAPIVTLQKVCFAYGEAEEEEKLVLKDVNVKLSMESRVGIVGANGAGKSTLMALLADRLPLREGRGELWYHEGLRLSYIAQHHLTHLSEHLENTPCEYLQSRFRKGYDITVPEKAPRSLNEAEEKERWRLGMQFGKKSKPVAAILDKKEQLGASKQRETLYLVEWEKLGESDRSWEGLGQLNKVGATALVEDYEARLFAIWAGGAPRSIAREDVEKHLVPFGLNEEISSGRKISSLSSGQKVKLLFAAAMWTKPHLLCLDEPTNFLDPESILLLQQALQEFKGAYCVVTHNQDFAKAVCEEFWTVAEKQVTGQKKIYGNAKLK